MKLRAVSDLPEFRLRRGRINRRAYLRKPDPRGSLPFKMCQGKQLKSREKFPNYLEFNLKASGRAHFGRKGTGIFRLENFLLTRSHLPALPGPKKGPEDVPGRKTERFSGRGTIARFRILQEYLLRRGRGGKSPPFFPRGTSV